jgi:hypothetical protein
VGYRTGSDDMENIILGPNGTRTPISLSSSPQRVAIPTTLSRLQTGVVRQIKSNFLQSRPTCLRWHILADVKRLVIFQ